MASPRTRVKMRDPMQMTKLTRPAGQTFSLHCLQIGCVPLQDFLGCQKCGRCASERCTELSAPCGASEGVHDWLNQTPWIFVREIPWLNGEQHLRLERRCFHQRGPPPSFTGCAPNSKTDLATAKRHTAWPNAPIAGCPSRGTAGTAGTA